MSLAANIWLQRAYELYPVDAGDELRMEQDKYKTVAKQVCVSCISVRIAV